MHKQISITEVSVPKKKKMDKWEEHLILDINNMFILLKTAASIPDIQTTY
jgi:hypothetical protein